MAASLILRRGFRATRLLNIPTVVTTISAGQRPVAVTIFESF